MKKRKNKSKKAWLVVILLLICCGAIFLLKDKDINRLVDILPNNNNSKEMSVSDISLNSEIVELSVKEDILKIDMITPSLDTCSLKTMIYDTEENKAFSTTDFSEGTWVSGLTANGYYVTDIIEKTVFLYDKSGKQVFSKNFSDDKNWSYAAAVSYDEKYFAYTDSVAGVMHVYDIKNENEKQINLKYSLNKIFNFENDTLTVLGINGETAKININDSTFEIISDDQRCSYKSPNYSLGTTEYNFICSFADKTLFIPFSTVDEMVVGMGENAFATTVLQDDKNIVRIYLLDEQKTYIFDVKENVENIIFSDKECFILTGSVIEKNHKILRKNYKNSKTEDFKILNQDIAVDNTQKVDITPANPQNNTKIIKNVPLISQFPEYPTGCESVSTVMVMQYLGEKITVQNFVENYLPKNSEFYISEDKKYGPSPYEHFIGNPTSSGSFGCMAPVIERSLKNYYNDNTIIKNTTGTEISELCKAYIDNDIPVILWATINMLETNPTNTWYLADGKRFTWPGNEHCMVLVGTDNDNYYFNDPYSGKLVKYDKEMAESRYAELGMQSIVILKQ